MKKTILKTNFNFPNQLKSYKGKVRDVYTIKNDILVVVASDRISAFDHILPSGIPYKGQVLNQISTYFLEETKDIVPNWLIGTPDPCVSVGYKCEPIRVEMVIRGYLTGHAFREYKLGKRTLCGVNLPDGLKENDPFPEPIITPAIKADSGHDEDISKADIISKKYVSEEIYSQMEKYTKALFKRGTEIAAEKGLILVDTKYEFGLRNGELILIDEIHTPDSSRYFYADGYEERQLRGEPQRQLSKEFVREWLMEHGFQGLAGQQMPLMPNDFINTVSERYIELFEKVTGKKFIGADDFQIEQRIYSNTVKFLDKISV
ncbi:MAG: phosphoribosylaminoimidazolesuccinocarboxamide synthase [Brumimicrobium sp.]